jgi:hypothetical protein
VGIVGRGDDAEERQWQNTENGGLGKKPELNVDPMYRIYQRSDLPTRQRF